MTYQLENVMFLNTFKTNKLMTLLMSFEKMKIDHPQFLDEA